MSNENTAALRIVSERSLASVPADDSAPPAVATARKAVPLLWLGLFDFDEAEVRSTDTGDVFLGVTGVGQAIARAEALAKALPDKDPPLAGQARLVARQLSRHAPTRFLSLFPTEIFAALRPEHVRLYLQRLFGICEVWEKLRKGTSWADARKLFDKLGPEVGNALGQEERVLSYYLLGTLAERYDPLEEARVREGQAQADQEPEALAVGEQGLLLGRFGGRWKLMSSGTDQDLRALWGDPGNVFIVGRRGTILRLRKGLSSSMESATTSHLHAVWGQGPRFVCAAGEDGAVVVFQGKAWQPWPVPSRATFACIGGAGSDICIGAQDLTVLRFDGRTWTKTQLPDQGMASRIWGQDGQLFAIGGSRRGGELYACRRGVWERDDSLPRSDWLEAVWRGWNDELGLVSASGPLLLRREGRWGTEPPPAEHLSDVAAGTLVVAAGQIGRYGVLCRRDPEEGWKVEATVPDLRIAAVWVVGRPKPPRLAEGQGV
jgi:hypothetical protein